MRSWAYERDPYTREATARILSSRVQDGTYVVVLDDTIFYPEGGGQPCDLGTLGGSAVLDVSYGAEGVVEHSLERKPDGEEVALVLDWERRFDHMQHHTGQHLLSAIAEDRFGWATTAFHLGGELCDVELDTPSITATEKVDLEAQLNAEIRAARPVKPRRVSRDEYATLGVRSRGLPDGHEGDVRLVEIEGLDLNTCGGTHLRSTAEIEAIKLLHTEGLRGGTRLFFIAGRRLRTRLARHEERNLRLRQALDVGDDELVGAVERRLEQVRDLGRDVRFLESVWADALVAELAGETADVVHRHLDRDAKFLQATGRALAKAARSVVALLTNGDGAFVVVVGPDRADDAKEAGALAAEAMRGRGGGGGPLFQGKGETSERAAAVDALLRWVATSSR